MTKLTYNPGQRTCGRDIGNIKLDQPIIMAADDSVSVSSGQSSYLITQASLFANDTNFNGGMLQVKSFGLSGVANDDGWCGMEVA